MAQGELKSFVNPLCGKLAAQMGFELVDTELVKEGPWHYLRIFLDKEGGFTLADCERFHRAVQPLVETVPYDFLEVSSAGADRPLTTDRDFEKAVGKAVEVKLYKPLDGEKRLVGTLAAFDRENIRLETEAGEKILPRKAAALIKPMVVFDEADEGEESNEQGSR